ncbi:MAG: hypothetical protein ACN4GM_14445 [Gammaproteobacteria bacterium]
MNTESSQHYSIRQLSPFKGSIHIVSLPYARALTNDGINWQIQVSCEVHQQQWNINNDPGIQRRYIFYGFWTESGGISRIPLDPSLDVPDESYVEELLVGAIQLALPELPFTAADHYELWLLDNCHNLPIALLRSATDPHQLDQIDIHRWRASDQAGHNFNPQQAACNTDPVLKLQSLINDDTCCPPRAQWFLRENDGSGLGLQGQNLDSALVHRRLIRQQFPELLIKENWQEPFSRMLAEDYHHWLSPSLLTLSHISLATRQRLEDAAVNRALDVSRRYKLYPTITRSAWLNRILVETKLRKSLT